MNKIGIYIHTPFCNSICPYCDFYSIVTGEQQKEDYTKAVIASIQSQPFGNLSGNTLYFGGGTPTTLGAKRLDRILAAAVPAFGIDKATDEITIEANPNSVSPAFLQELFAVGFNRISFGLQSGVGKELIALGRRHNPDEGRQAVLWAKEAGFENISVDLMIGTPYQTEESLVESINYLTALPVDHISGYMLSIEEGTPFAKNHMERFAMEESALADAYVHMVEAFGEKGFAQYELSNFQKGGKPSVHNLKYWNTEPYLGIGTSAHSFINGERFSLPADLGLYTKEKGNWNLRVADGTGGDYAEYGMLKLRLIPGLNLKTYKTIYPQVDTGKIFATAKILEKEGMVEVNGETITFTPKGFMLSNYFIAQLLF